MHDWIVYWSISSNRIKLNLQNFKTHDQTQVLVCIDDLTQINLSKSVCIRILLSYFLVMNQQFLPQLLFNPYCQPLVFSTNSTMATSNTVSTSLENYASLLMLLAPDFSNNSTSDDSFLSRPFQQKKSTSSRRFPF